MKRNNKNQFPGIPRVRNTSTSENAITENVEILTGVRGTNRALLLSDLINLDDLKRKALIDSSKGNNSGSLPIVPGGGIEPPHAPVNLQGTGGFTFIAISWDSPTYKGHAYAEIFRSETDVYSEATRIATEVTDIFSDTVNMGAKYYYWVRFVNKADMKGPTQGAAGLYVETQQSAEQILAEIGGLIEQSHLGPFLSTEVGELPSLISDMYDVNGLVQTIKSNANGSSSISISYVNAEFNQLAMGQIENALANDIENEKSIKATASVLSQQRVIAEESQSIAENLTILTTQFNESKSFIARLTQSIADNTQSTARDLLQLIVKYSNLSASLVNEYYTRAAADSAISTATTTLKSAIENPTGNSVGANIYNNYYTKVTANTAISAANNILKSSIEDANGNSVGAALQTLSETVVTNDEKWAMWGVKATVGDITASFGLVNDGTDPIFAIKGAKFAIITDQDPNNLTPIFAVVGNKTVIKSALIDQAFIQSLVTDNLLSNRIVVGSELQTPSINYNRNTGARSQNFSISPNGVMHAKAAVLESVVIKNASGAVVMSSTGAIDNSQVNGLGNLALLDDVSSTYISDFGIAVNAKITTKIDAAYIKALLVDQLLASKIYAENIEGDVVDAKPYSYSSTITVDTNKTVTIISGSIAPGRFDRVLAIGSNTFSIKLDPNSGSVGTANVSLTYYVGSISVGTSGTYSVSGEGSDYGFVWGDITIPPSAFNIPSKTSATAFSIKATVSRGGNLQANPTVDHKAACVVSLFKAGGALS